MQERGRDKLVFEYLKCLLGDINPHKWCSFFQQIKQRARDDAEVTDEPAVEPSQAQETSHFLGIRRRWPSLNCLNFGQRS